MDYQILINKNNKISKNQILKVNFVEYKSEYSSNTMLVEEKTLEMFLKLKDYVKSSKNIIMDIEDAYRSVEDSKIVYDRFCIEKGKYYADKFVALPYTSEHNMGLAIDYTIKINNDFIKSSPDYEYMEESIYINKNAHKFGFILRYQKGKEDITEYNFEPWHLRYVGVELATYLFENNLVLEEKFK